MSSINGGSQLEELVERMPLLRGRDREITPLSGGHMNGVFLIRVEGAKYVLRVPATTGALLVPDRGTARRNAEAAAAAGVSPRVLDYLDDVHVMLVEYVEGRAMTEEELASVEQIPRVAETLRRLHAANRFGNDFDMFAAAERWLRLCDEREIAFPGVHERMGEVRLARQALDARPMLSVPSHNDLAPDNFIDDGRRLWLVDFEYSGNNDPCYDVGDVANESDLDEDWRARLCEAYFGRADPIVLARTLLHSLIGNAAWAIWASVQTNVSTLDIDFGAIRDAYWADVVSALDSDRFPRRLRQDSGGTVGRLDR